MFVLSGICASSFEVLTKEDKSKSVVKLHEFKRHDKVKILKRPYSRDESQPYQTKSDQPLVGADRPLDEKNMFTGIITHLGTISGKSNQTLKISAAQSFLSKIKKGDSLAVNGICLTAASLGKDYFQVDVMPETHRKTNLKYLKIGDLINLELPATPTSFLSGHIVQGHIDGIGQITKINSQLITIAVPKNISHYLVEKGSIAVNGISLTIIETYSDSFTVGIIPHTWNNTMLQTIKIGDFVNIEVDILAKYLR